MQKIQYGAASTKRTYIDGEGDIKIALIDFGCKENIVRELKKRNCQVTVFPHDTSYEEIIEVKPDGIVLSNGPRRSRRLRNRNSDSKKII